MAVPAPAAYVRSGITRVRNMWGYPEVLPFRKRVESGGLIGPPGTPREYEGAFDGTPVFLGCSDTDPHIPVERVRESAAVLRRMDALVDERIYPGTGHGALPDRAPAVCCAPPVVSTARDRPAALPSSTQGPAPHPISPFT